MNDFTPDELRPLSDSEVQVLLQISGRAAKDISPIFPLEFEELIAML